jgi:hypothetical protein
VITDERKHLGGRTVDIRVGGDVNHRRVR